MKGGAVNYVALKFHLTVSEYVNGTGANEIKRYGFSIS